MRLCPFRHGLIFCINLTIMKKIFIAFASILSLAFVSCSDLTSSGGGSGSFFDKWWKLSEVYQNGAWTYFFDGIAYYRFGSDGTYIIYDGVHQDIFTYTYNSKDYIITLDDGPAKIKSISSNEMVVEFIDDAGLSMGVMYKFVAESPVIDDTPVVPDDPDDSDNPDVPSVEESGIVGKWQIYQLDDGEGWYDATGGDDVVTEFTSTGIIYAYENGVTVSEQGEYEYYESTNTLEMSYYIGGEYFLEYYTVVSLTSSEMILAFSESGYMYRIKLRRV